MESAAAHRTLNAGEMLNWYRIDGVLGRGGFGVIYLATDTNLDHAVAIKEYIPAGCARRDGDTAVRPLTEEHGDLYRWGLERFIKEARNLVRFKHPNIVRVMSVFQQNNTAYMVMEFEAGVDLSKYLAQDGSRSEASLKALIGPVCEGLAEVHRHGFIHRDIKPANILVRSDGSPVLLDFGSARDATLGRADGLTALVTVGYAPLEQYDDGSDEQQGPWTDIYALGGVLYNAITGNDPVDSARRGSALLNGGRDPLIAAATLGRGRYSASFLAAIDWALEFRIADRPQTLHDWLPALLGRSMVGPRPTAPVAVAALSELGLGRDEAPTRLASVDSGRAATGARVSQRAGPAGMASQPLLDDVPVPTTRTHRTHRRRQAERRRLLWAVPLLAAASAGIWVLSDTPSPAPSVPLATIADTSEFDEARRMQQERLQDLERREQAFELRQKAEQDRQATLAAEREARLAQEQQAQERRDAEAARLAELAESERLEADRQQAAQLARSSTLFARALDEAEAALAERRTGDARQALARAAETGFEDPRLGEMTAQLDTIVEEMRRPVTDDEFDRVVRRFDGLKRAIESKDRAVINALTEESEQNALFRQLMNNFEQLNMEITGIRVRNADKSVTANLRIKDMIRKNGDRAMPSDAFRDREITSRLQAGEWSPIGW